MAAELRDAFNDVARTLDDELSKLVASQAAANAANERGPAVPARELPKAIRTRVALFMRTVKFEIEVPGAHYSGLSNDQLIEILANQGRDFLDNTSVGQRQELTRRMQEAFTGFPHVPSLAELQKEHTKQLKLHIANERFAGGADQKLRPLTAKYAAWKRKKVGLKPIGVLRGKLLAAFRKQGRVNYL